MAPTRGPVPVRATERDLPHEVLAVLGEKDTIVTNEDFPDVEDIPIKAAIARLASRAMVEYKQIDKEIVLLTKEGESICAEGSHEYKVWDAVKRKGKIAIKDLPVCIMPKFENALGLS
jgi:phenylalanyl-tRNA synthetase alpha chain